ncbi:bifunctional proline dehydrogenase/L-glutamate gamma-semialdehyde dehydrogenase PutA [Haliea sp. E17]|uniref:bifunctional proline dehydrogenase/L-glutamate gamma-semialdehyde dehydrogenase PutA n=1 Tax=Haliea sp. E17 TaxID=3401576 RepID=UPI003AABCD35
MPDELDAIRLAIRRAWCADESRVVGELLAAARLDAEARGEVCRQAAALVDRCRSRSHRAGTLDAFLMEFGLSNQEGIALMCLAESLLRVPDDATADRLIAEKIRSGDWAAHRGKSTSSFVNASVWGLMLTGRVIGLDPAIERDPDSWMQRLVNRLGEPLVRASVMQAMRILGRQYVLGRSIEEALSHSSRNRGAALRYSFDMLGEGARTAAAAQGYFDAYQHAIERIAAGKRGDVYAADGISIKLSALHPRYEYAQQQRVVAELLPRLRALALLAREGDIGLSIDAEESQRLDLSLSLFEALAHDPALASWQGLGFVLQAYQKRAVPVARWLLELARCSKRRIMVRLVKGAYWDSEIKHAQELGLADYPVFTRKCHTDLSYQVCAQTLLQCPGSIYPQFATHNAHTVRQVLALAGAAGDFEFQRLHGMGHLLYEALAQDLPAQPVRIYAPVGSHRDLLPYLVRRLLENGANSSFVNRFLDAQVPVAQLVEDPVAATTALKSRRHPQIPRPADLYATAAIPWRNSAGLDLADPLVVPPLLKAVSSASPGSLSAAPIVDGVDWGGAGDAITSPADARETLGEVVPAAAQAIDTAMASAARAWRDWDRSGADSRAGCLERAADLFEQHRDELLRLLVREAGRTLPDALSELREAVDFCRYYAAQGRVTLAPRDLPGPAGESNRLSLHGRGVFFCVSPWNFPLAIFTGQVAAALMAGNAVLAKPAEQTPLVAARVVRLLHAAGVPVEVLHLLPGDGPAIGRQVLADDRLAGVAFTGSLATAAAINRQLAARDGAIIPLIAETGGLNAMLADATALPEQLVDDVIRSAFHSAGQRCSALRILYLQEDIADPVLEMLRGAMAELAIGDPADLATDIGPVIDREARDSLETYCLQLTQAGRCLAACETLPQHAAGWFVPPRVFGVEGIGSLPGEVFGPVLHVARYRAGEIGRVLRDIDASAFGLTLGVHSRIDGFAREVLESTRIGNTYINRNMVGAVVGVNPFGGQRLSGTGPKAGGPHYLLRFATECTRTEDMTARGGNTALFSLRDR